MSATCASALETDVLENLISEGDIMKATDTPFSPRELLDAKEAINIGLKCGALSNEQYSLAYHQLARRATTQDLQLIRTWKKNVEHAGRGQR